MRTRPCLLILLAATAWSQTQRVVYFPRPVKRTPFQAPMKPITRLADLKAKHQGKTNWSELVVDDGNTRAHVISAPPGTKVVRHLYPDSPEWWVVQEGRIRFEIETADGVKKIEARKGSYVFAPERHFHSLEVVGDTPAIRVEVTLGQASPVYETKPENPPQGIEYLPITLSIGKNLEDIPGDDRLHMNIEDLEATHKGQRSWSEPTNRKNRIRGNFHYGYAADLRRQPGNRGHLHADFAEMWIVMRGKLQWTMEGIDRPFVGEEGDIVYAPPNTFHLPEFYGDGPACRLTSSSYPGSNHIYDAPQRK